MKKKAFAAFVLAFRILWPTIVVRMKIVCIGRNYLDHAKELNNPVPSRPVVFLKPDTALLDDDRPFHIPRWTQEVHYEIELVVRISERAKDVSLEEAHRYYEEVSVGIDFTARDVQAELKEKAHPWERAKAFDDSAVIGKFVELRSLGKSFDDLRFQLLKNGEVVQDGHSADMIFPIAELISEVSAFLTLMPGDLIFTGTPAGVGKVNSEDRLEGKLEGETLFSVEVRSAAST